MNLTYTLAHTLGRAGVRINAVAPGTVDTLGMQQNEAGVIEELEGLEDFLGDVIRGTPMRRLGTPAEIAAVVAFLASEGAGYVTGAVVPVDGGITRGLL